MTVYLAMGHDVGGNTGDIVLGVYSRRDTAMAVIEQSAPKALSVWDQSSILFEGWKGNEALIKHSGGYLGFWIEEWEVDGEYLEAREG
jgi:hypothetical protein